jgi:metacaspase-1
MTGAVSVHIGLNSVDSAHYNGWSGNLNACEADAHSMEQIAKSRRFEPKVLLTRSATAQAVSAAIRDAASHLDTGGFFFFTHSGHGGQVPDRNGDEKDKMDETWVLYDRQLVDDELYALWARFKPGVRIFVLSDSCHSGSVTRDIAEAAVPHVVEHAMVDTQSPRHKDLPRNVQDATYDANKELYDGIQRSNPAAEKAQIGADVILISGCQDNQLSLDGDRNGLFTQNLLKVWNNGRWRGSYRRFQQAIGAEMPPTQSPNYFRIGASDPKFEGQAPLTV